MTEKKVDGRSKEAKAAKAAKSNPGDESISSAQANSMMDGMARDQLASDRNDLDREREAFRAEKLLHTQSLADDANMRAERDTERAADHDMSGRNKINNLEYDAVAHDKNRRLDADYYIKKYPDMQFMWRNHLDGGVEHWLGLGAEPQLHETDENIRTFKGLNDRSEDGYVSVPGGAAEGVPFTVYLLKMSKVDYQQKILGPELRRSQELQRAMGIDAKAGKVGGAARDVAPDVNTYAPETVTGEVGFGQTTGALDESEFAAIGGQGGFNSITGG